VIFHSSGRRGWSTEKGDQLRAIVVGIAFVFVLLDKVEWNFQFISALEWSVGAGVDLESAWSGADLSLPIRFAKVTRPMQIEAKGGWSNLSMESVATGRGPDGALQLKLRPLQDSWRRYR
jgi:hypothetical protein